MTDATPRLALPMLAPGQAQKEMTHNAGLAVLDAAVQASVLAAGIDAPPADPVPGQSWIVGAAPTGDWIGQADALATWTDAGWRFVAPTPGFRAWVAAEAVDARFVDGAWTLGVARADQLVLGGHAMLSTPAGAVADPSGGGVVDSEARAAIAAILAALRHHNLVEMA